MSRRGLDSGPRSWRQSRGAQHFDATGPAEECWRRFVRQGQRVRREEVGVLQGEPPAQDGVARGVGDGQPSRARREMPELLWSLLLKLLVRLGEIVHPQPEAIVA